MHNLRIRSALAVCMAVAPAVVVWGSWHVHIPAPNPVASKISGEKRSLARSGRQ